MPSSTWPDLRLDYSPLGKRQQTTSGSGSFQTLTTTAYLLGHDEQTTTQQSGQPATATATRYYPTPGGALLLRDASGLSFLATDALGTPIATVNLDSGAVLGEQLRAPYGEGRYAVAAGAPLSGGMHSSVGFTGQREDAASSGLYYYRARYYDPAAGVFTSADTVLAGGLNRYAYVRGNPTSRVDPTGYEEEGDRNETAGGGDGSEGEGGEGGFGGNGPAGTMIAGPSVESTTTSATLSNGDVVVENADGSQYSLENAQGDIVQEGQTDGTQFETQADSVQNGEVQNEGSELKAQEAEQQQEQQQQQQKQSNTNQPNHTTPSNPQPTDNPNEGNPPKLPNSQNANINPNKFTKYSMDPTNEANDGKWEGWRDMGYNVEDENGRLSAAQDVMNQLREGLENSPAEYQGRWSWGDRWKTFTKIVGPGAMGTLESVWQMEDGVPRMISNWIKVGS